MCTAKLEELNIKLKKEKKSISVKILDLAKNYMYKSGLSTPKNGGWSVLKLAELSRPFNQHGLDESSDFNCHTFTHVIENGKILDGMQSYSIYNLPPMYLSKLFKHIVKYGFVKI